MKYSSTRTLLVLKSLWINGGARVCSCSSGYGEPLLELQPSHGLLAGV
ncbi:hypothetical protein SETIT_5G383900v2 [Setaria italica]|uniref:Uncharacterized protein n=1 Tax=Setaria italica TaxID=4555 RepID=A0A368RDA2_SETIT|nr:hypothetical protein SETIT_5G383900v2 [Setaria italica]